MKKIINVVIMVATIYLFIAWGIQMVGFFGALFGADACEDVIGGIRLIKGTSTQYMPWRWIAWTCLNKPAKIIGLQIVDRVVDLLTGEKAEVAA